MGQIAAKLWSVHGWRPTDPEGTAWQERGRVPPAAHPGPGDSAPLYTLQKKKVTKS